MVTHLPATKSAVLHPAIQLKMEAMQKARRQELMELKGSALGFAQCQVALNDESEAYLENVAAIVNAGFSRRERYLENVPLAMMAFIPWFLNLAFAAIQLLFSLLPGRWVGDLTFFPETIFFLFVMHAIIHFSIGFKCFWLELCRHKWAWLLALSMTTLSFIVIVNELMTHEAL